MNLGLLRRQAKPETIADAISLIRLAVGSVFLVEGILKFLYPSELAAGRFAKIGIPDPTIMGPVVGGVEVVCGALVLAGLFTCLATIPLLIVITVAIVSTKVPILLGHGFWHFAHPKVAHLGFLGMVHEARTDFAMCLGLVFLLIVGSGGVSLDASMGDHS
jgi:putative oxidoreductase